MQAEAEARAQAQASLLATNVLAAVA